MASLVINLIYVLCFLILGKTESLRLAFLPLLQAIER
jgi:hypothetical protein